MGLVSEPETSTLCSWQLSSQVTSTQLADKWAEAEINQGICGPPEMLRVCRKRGGTKTELTEKKKKGLIRD